jgi:hypothetical protein
MLYLIILSALLSLATAVIAQDGELAADTSDEMLAVESTEQLALVSVSGDEAEPTE